MAFWDWSSVREPTSLYRKSLSEYDFSSDSILYILGSQAPITITGYPSWLVRCNAAIKAPSSSDFIYCISSIKKQIGTSDLYAVSPIVTNTSVRLCVRLMDLYNSFSCMDREKVLSLGSKDTTNDLIASSGFWIRFLNFSFVLTLLKNAWEQDWSIEIR